MSGTARALASIENSATSTRGNFGMVAWVDIE